MASRQKSVDETIFNKGPLPYDDLTLLGFFTIANLTAKSTPGKSRRKEIDMIGTSSCERAGLKWSHTKLVKKEANGAFEILETGDRGTRGMKVIFLKKLNEGGLCKEEDEKGKFKLC